MATFVLVHGAWHGAWCWKRTVAELEAAGHRALAPDLPGHGADRTPAFRVTLRGYAERVLEVAASCAEPVVVAGHSMGGVVAAQAAALAPERFSAVIHVCAYVPAAGETVAALAREDAQSGLHPSMRRGLVRVSLRPAAVRELFYADCSDEVAAWAVSMLRPQPLRPLFGRLQDGAAAPAPRRAYVECTNDRAITLAHQRSMVARAGIDAVATMEAGHSPFLSAPASLAGHLSDLAESAA